MMGSPMAQERVAMFGDHGDHHHPIPHMAPIQRVQSIYELPATQYIPASPQHHSPINPTPLSKSIEEAARSQLQFKGCGVEEKYSSKKTQKKRKEKRRKRERKEGTVKVE